MFRSVKLERIMNYICIAARLSLQIPVLNVPDVHSNFRIVSTFEGQMVDT